MNISINNESINFTLEKENKLSEIVPTIINYLKPFNLYITDIYVNGKDTFFSDLENLRIKDINLGEINSLDIAAQFPLEIRLKNMNTLAHYFNMLNSSLQSRNIETIFELKDEFKHIYSSFGKIINPSFLGESSDDFPSLKILQEIFSSPDFSQNNTLNSQYIPRILYITEQFLNILNDRIHEITDSVNELVSTILLLEGATKELAEVSVMLQTGKDKDAMTIIIRFSELFQKLVRLFTYLHDSGTINLETTVIGSSNLKQHYSEINALLEELLTGFSKKDFILIGDLLEYEIAPRVESILEEIRKLKFS